MKLLEKITNTHQVAKTPFGTLYSIKNENDRSKIIGLFHLVESKNKLLLNEPVWFFKEFNGKVIFQNENGSCLKEFNGENIQQISKQRFYLDTIKQAIPNLLKLSYRDKDLNQTLYQLNTKYNLSQINRLYDLQFENLFIYKGFSKTNIQAYNRDEELVWDTKASDFGRNIMRHRDTKEVLSDKPNEIDGDIFNYNGLIYTPLRGGQLLALNAKDGSKAWFLEHEISGAYQILEDKIYKKTGKELYEIEAATGKVLREKKLKQDPKLSEFHASGPLWVYDDVIIVVDVFYGKICILERKTFEVLDFFSINYRIINNNNALVWHENKLYVLDIDNTLHIFEKE